jgi:GTP cyclohydrolase I
MIETSGSLEESIRTLLEEIGEDPSREGLVRTPERIGRMYAELTAGYRVDADALINGACFSVDYDEMVVVRDIEFFSLCEHHLLPFIGKAHVGYLPRGRVIGLSKIPRIVDMYAQRLQVQERLTVQVADFLMERLEP